MRNSYRSQRGLRLRVNVSALIEKLLCFLLQTNLQRFFFGNLLLRCKSPHVLGDVDELRPPAKLALRVTLNVIYLSRKLTGTRLLSLAGASANDVVFMDRSILRYCDF